MISPQTHDTIYAKRRRHKDFFYGYPLHKRIIRRVEQANKILWTGLLGKLLGVRPIAAPLDPRAVKSILFIRNDAIGDMVLTTPLWHAIRNQFPHIRIGVAASFRNRAVLDQDPNVDIVFDATEGDLKALWRAKREIGKEHWDVVMPMMYYRKTKMAVVTRFLAPGSISSTLVKPGESVEKRGKLFSIVVQSPYRTEDIEMVEQMRIHLCGVLDMTIMDEEWKLHLYPDPTALKLVEERTHAIIASDGTVRYFHINLEAKTAFKEYGNEASLDLSRRLLEEYPDASVLWTSSPQAATEIGAFLSAHPTSRLHFFKTGSLHELFALVKGASLVVTPDTSVVHIASAFERPVVALYPVRHEWPPYKTPYRLLLSEREQPVSRIPVAMVLGACRELLMARVVAPS